MIGRNKPAPTPVSAVALQWANGKSYARPFEKGAGVGRFAPHVGFYIEIGKDGEIDEALGRAGIKQIEIRHQREGGSEIARHWDLGASVKFYPITSGPVATTVASSLAGANARKTRDAGIGVYWPSDGRSKTAVRGLLDVLVRVGCLRLVQLAVRSRMGDVLLAVLADHARVAEAADDLVDRERHPEIICLHEIALPLGEADEQTWGKVDTAEVVPFKSLHPAKIDAEYLRGLWRPDAVNALAYREWEAIQTWAGDYQAGKGTND
ncbi:hypothetical protein [Chloroflexus sp.]|uniref:hypothetical protein n=1 Tax=Chloroflexus sp. TaxID=1904827 RepID=UPI002ACEA4A0|nr:hypothetical protein [Chloroflexus sp.]